jgi:hypothetical protein
LVREKEIFSSAWAALWCAWLPASDIPDAPSGFRALFPGGGPAPERDHEYTYTLETIIQQGTAVSS